MSGGVQWVLPSIDPVYREECLASMSSAVRERTLVLDNSRHNRGVAVSWNLGRERMLHDRAGWLVLLSESIRFGANGGEDWEKALTGGSIVTGACDGTCTEVWSTGQGFCRRGYGWHLTALPRATLERVGRFDEIFWPAWLEDTDYRYRMILAGIPGPDPVTGAAEHHVTGIDAHLVACEHSLAMGLVRVRWEDHFELYRAKWGGGPGGEKWDRPYGFAGADWTAVTKR